MINLHWNDILIYKLDKKMANLTKEELKHLQKLSNVNIDES
jgi:hypothetical protein